MIRHTSFDPFAEVFPHVLRGLVQTPRRSASPRPADTLSVRIDVRELDNAYLVHADMPGVAKEDINVEIDGARVAVSGTVKSAEPKAGSVADSQVESDAKTGVRADAETSLATGVESSGNAGNVLRRERYQGTFSRTFELASEIDEDAARASYENGVLELTLPKKAVASARRLSVN